MNGGHRNRLLVYIGLLVATGALLATAEAAAFYPSAPLVSGNFRAATPTPTATGGGTGKIAFWGYTGAGTDKPIICTINADGSDEKCWDGPPNMSGDGVWLPNGRQLAFLSRGQYYSTAPAYVMNDDGSGFQVWKNVNLLHWSPDGLHTLFEILNPGNDRNFRLFVGDVQGENPITVSENAEGNSASWSPDGSKIAFEEVIDGV